MFFGGSNFQQQNVYARNSRQFQRNTTADEGEVRVLTELYNWVFGASSKNNIFFVQQQPGYAALINLLPILLLIVLSGMSSFFISDPIYSLTPNQ